MHSLKKLPAVAPAVYKITHLSLQPYLFRQASCPLHKKGTLGLCLLVLQETDLPLYRIRQIRLIHRFQEEILHLETKALSGVFKAVIPCQYKHSKLRLPFSCFFDQFKPRHLRHLDIRYHDLRSLFL